MSATDFNLFIIVMFWCAVGIFALTMCLMVLLVIFRIRAIGHKRRVAACVSKWRAIFTQGDLPKTKPLRRKDVFTVLSLWNDFRRAKLEERGVGVPQLEQVARAQNLPEQARAMLARGDAGDRIVALRFLGYMHYEAALPQIRELTNDSFGEVALSAFRALVLIDRTEARFFARAIASHDEWRLGTIEQILLELGPILMSRPIVSAADEATDEQLLRLLRFFSLCDAPIAHAAVRDILSKRDDPDVVASCLRAVTPFVLKDDRAMIRPFLTHEIAFVRVAAIGAIAPICTVDDRDTLLQLLGDRNSWVRYRAAQTVLERLTKEGQEGSVEREVADRYAKDALKQVLAERSVVAPATQSENAPEREIDGRRRAARLPMDVMRVGS